MATQHKLEVIIEAKIKQFQKDLDAVKQQTKKTTDDVRAAWSNAIGGKGTGKTSNAVKDFGYRMQEQARQMTKEYAAACKEVDNLKKKLYEASSAEDAIARNYPKTKSYRNAEEMYGKFAGQNDADSKRWADHYRKQMRQMENEGKDVDFGAKGYGRWEAQLEKASNKTQELEAAFAKAKAKRDELFNSGKAFKTEGLRNTVPLMKRIGGVFQTTGKGIRTATQRVRRFRSELHKLNPLSKILGSKLFKMAMMFVIGARLMRGAVRMIQQGFTNLAQYSSETNNDIKTMQIELQYLKNGFATAFAPILSVIVPILATFIDWLVAGMTAIAHFFSALTGKSFTVIARKTSAGISAIGDSASGAADSTDALKKSLMGFDQVNKLDDNSSGSGGGSGGGSGAGSMFDTVPIDAGMSEWADKFKEAWKNADFTEIGEIVGDKLNNALESIDWEKIKETSRKIAKSIATFLNGFISETDWNLVGKTFAEGINTAIEFAYTFVTTFNWLKFGQAIGEAISGAIENIDWAKLAETISELLKGAFDTATGFITSVKWDELGIAVTELVLNVDYLGIVAKAINLVGSVLEIPAKITIGTVEGIIKWIYEKATGKDSSNIQAKIDLTLGKVEEVLEWIVKWIVSPTSVKVQMIVDLVAGAMPWAKGKDGKDFSLTGVADIVFGDSVSKVKDTWADLKSKWGDLSATASVKLGTAASTVRGWWETLKGKFSDWSSTFQIKAKLPKVSVSWVSKSFKIFKKKFSFKYPSFNVSYAQGGFPEDGLFFANSKEMVGKFTNGKSVVANNMQITKGISNAVEPAVYNAMMQALMQGGNGGTNGNITIVLEGDAKGLFKSVKQEADNYTRATGQPAFSV